jgi:hypothetical protein
MGRTPVVPVQWFPTAEKTEQTGVIVTSLNGTYPSGSLQLRKLNKLALL